jgi:hypothetical protein
VLVITSFTEKESAMSFLSHKVGRRSRAWLVMVCLAAGVSVAATGATKRPIKRPKFDASAEQVELFEGIEQGAFEALLIPKNSMSGNLFIANKTDKPLTVKLPKAAAAVQVLKQGFGNTTGMGSGSTSGSNSNNQQQSMGMGMGGGMMGGGMGMMGGGMGMFSIPPESTVQLSLKSVCLEHGKPEPSARARYRLVPVEEFSDDPALKELLEIFGDGQLDQQAVQAAAWHLTDDMSWEELAHKQIRHLGGVPPTPYFSRRQLLAAQQLVSQAQAIAREKAKQPKTDVERSRVLASDKKL